MKWAIWTSVILHFLILSLVFKGAHSRQKAYPPVMMVHLSSPPPALGVQNPAVEKATPVETKQVKKSEPAKENTRVAEVNQKKRPKKPEPKPAPAKEEAKPQAAETKSKGLPEGVALGSEFGFARLDATGFDSPIYLNILFGKIRNLWENPYTGADAVSCVVYFVISRDGKIADSVIEKSSGVEVYDQSALRAVLASKPPPLPGQFGSDELGIHLEFQYIPNM